jgi:hypothetical protein
LEVLEGFYFKDKGLDVLDFLFWRLILNLEIGEDLWGYFFFVGMEDFYVF